MNADERRFAIFICVDLRPSPAKKEYVSCAGDRQLVQLAQTLKGELTVDVNEQNISACHFYESCGFITEARSALDTTGRPFPLLHMRLAAKNSPLL